MNCNNNQNNNNGCGCNCNPHPTPAPEPVDINMNVCDRNINMLPMLQTYTTKVLKPNIDGCCKKNILKQCMMNCENYKYVIKWDFDLNGETITVPENCILEFDGGSLKNGTIIGQDTVYINVGDVDIWGENLTREGTWREHSGGGGGSEEDRPYDPSSFVGMGKKYLQRNIVGDKNILTQGMISEANTIYVFQYDFDLDGEEIEIPQKCVLEFDGGTVSNGDIELNDTIIISDNEAFKNIGFKGIVNNSYIHLKWIDYSVEGAFQDFVNLAIRSKKNIDLDGLILDIAETIIIDKPHIPNSDAEWWLTIRNGSINISCPSLFETPTDPSTGDPKSLYSQYILLKDIIFNNTRMEYKPYPEGNDPETIAAYWEDYNTEEDKDSQGFYTGQVRVFSGNHFFRVNINSCTFNNVSLLQSGGYIQSFYITDCLIHDMRFTFVRAFQVYDFHFINNSVEWSHKSIIIDATITDGIFVIGNLIESVRCAVLYRCGLQVTIQGNYFEGCHESAVKSYNVGDESIPWATNITGNFFAPDLLRDVLSPVYENPQAEPEERVIDHYMYFYADLQAKETDFVIQANSFHKPSPEPGKEYPEKDGKPIIIKDVIFRHNDANGLYLHSSLEDISNMRYNGSYQIPTIQKFLGKDNTSSVLDKGLCGTLVPYSYMSQDFVTDGRGPVLVDAKRFVMNHLKVKYGDDGTDCVWTAMFADSNKHHIPWTYIKRQLAEDSKAYSDYYEIIHAEGHVITPEEEAHLAELSKKVQTPWVKQALIIDRNFDPNHYLDADLGKPGSFLEFDKDAEGSPYSQYYNGLMRFHGSYGIQYWNYDGWVRANGIPMTAKYIDYSGEEPVTVEFDVLYSGTTANRPKFELVPAYTSQTVYAGFMYFDTTICKPVFFCGSDKRGLGDNGWVDANGENPYATNNPNTET